MKKDLEEECWSVFDSIGSSPAEDVDRRLKALDLLVKIRSAGQKVKPEQQESDSRAATRAIVDKLNS